MFTLQVNGQEILGNFKAVNNTEISLIGFEGTKQKELNKAVSDSLGRFKISYPKDYVGAALIQIKGGASLIVLLNHENFSVTWDNLQDLNSLIFYNSIENQTFSKAININQETEQKLAGLKYLLPLYKNDKFLSKKITNEISKQQTIYNDFISNLPKTSYVKDYLKARKLLSDIQLAMVKYQDRIPLIENDFLQLDFANVNLWHSGLLKEIVEGYYKLMESYGDIPKVIERCNVGSTALLTKFNNNSSKQQEVAEYCFKVLEKYSLFKAAEYIALEMLNKSNCQLEDSKVNLFEQYRKMAVGNVAPDFNVTNNVTVKSIKSSYKLVVFGASWCPNCQVDYPELVNLYPELKSKYNLEIVYISLDTDNSAFESYYESAPFFTICDTKGWESEIVKDYYVFATPTYMLLNDDLMIIAKLNSPLHLKAWLEHNGFKR